MKIFVFNDTPDAPVGVDVLGVAITEDGRIVGRHVCSHSGFISHDLGVISTCHHDDYKTACPDGFTVERVPDNATKITAPEFFQALAKL